MNLFVLAALFFAQQPGPAPRVISSVQGSVINALTGEGLRKATVILRSTDTEKGISYAEEADPNGHFRIDDVQPGEYTVTADRQGFFLQPDGAPGAPAPQLKIAAGEQINNLVVKMAPTASINGRVVDQDGDPVRGAVVRAMQYVYVQGHRELRQTIQVLTKDKGDYRLFNLRPGRYFIQVVSHGPAGAIAFFPATVDPSTATPVEVRSGNDLRGYDITMPSQGTHTIRFTPPAGASVNTLLWLPDGTRPATLNYQFSDGHVTILGVSPGSYVLLVTRLDEPNQTYAHADVEVRDGDVDAGTLDFLPARDLSGTVKIDGAQLRQGLSIILQPDGPTFSGQTTAQIKPDGSFIVKELPPGSYRVALAGGGDNLYMKSIRLGDQALPDRRIDFTKSATDPLTVLLGADVAEIKGSVKKANGDPSVHARITLFPDGAIADRADFFKFTFSDEKGEFHFKGVAPGEYKIFAWQDVLAGLPQDPDFRKRFEKQSTSVKVPPSGHEKIDLTAISVAAAQTADR